MKNLILTKTRWLVTIIVVTILSMGNAWATTAFEETFANCTGTFGWSGSVANGDFVADNDGWTVANASGAGGSAKFGTGSKKGTAQTPAINCGSATTATLTFKAGAWNGGSEQTTLYLTYTNCSGDKSTVTMTKGSFTSYTVALSSISGNIKIQFAGKQASNSRFLLDDVVVTYTGGTTYTVSYAAGGAPSGSVPSSHTGLTSGASITLRNPSTGGGDNGTLVAPTGKQFAGWNDGSTTHAAGASYTVTSNVTMTAQWECITPTISGDPSAATYWDMDSPTALSVTASGGSLSYQWQMSANGSSSWSNVGTNSSSYTPLVANGTKYYRCVVTNTGSSCNTTATSNNALVTIKTLSSIAVKTTPKTTYFEGETFNPTGLVVTLTASDASTQDRSYASYSSGFTFSPTTATALTTSDAAVTITYGGKSVDQAINVYSVTVTKVDEDGTTISAAGVSASWAVSTKALAASATAGSKYVFKEWAFDGSNNGLSITSTSSANTTVTGTPTGNVTIKAVFYKPRVVKWSVNGNDSYNTGSPTSTIAYHTEWSGLKLPTDPTMPCGDTFVGWTTTDIGSTGLDKDDDAAAITALDLMTSANKSSKTGSGHYIDAAIVTFYAVVADYTTE